LIQTNKDSRAPAPRDHQSKPAKTCAPLLRVMIKLGKDTPHRVA
jgi:hypothetical protein